MKTKAFVVGLLALAIFMAVGGHNLAARSAAAAEAAQGPDPFEEWLMQQGEVVLEIDYKHHIFQHAMMKELVPVGPVTIAEYCVGNVCQGIELQWFEGTYTVFGPGASWQRWVCYAWARAHTAHCLAYVPPPYP